MDLDSKKKGKKKTKKETKQIREKEERNEGICLADVHEQDVLCACVLFVCSAQGGCLYLFILNDDENKRWKQLSNRQKINNKEG